MWKIASRNIASPASRIVLPPLFEHRGLSFNGTKKIKCYRKGERKL